MDTNKNIDYIVDKIQKSGSAFILSSPCSYTLEKAAIEIAKKLFTSELEDTEKVSHIKNRIDENLFPDFVKIAPEGKEIKVDQIKPILTMLNHVPMEAERRIIVIKDAHRLNKSTANRLLKPIEEPPHDTSFILLTTNISRLLPTILSRSEILRIPPINKSKVISGLDTELENTDFLYEISGSNKLRFDFFVENNDTINEILDFIDSKPKSFATIQKLSAEISQITDHDISKQEHIIYAIVKALQKNDYNLAKKVLDIFEGIYFNTKDTIIFENIFLELSK